LPSVTAGREFLRRFHDKDLEKAVSFMSLLERLGMAQDWVDGWGVQSEFQGFRFQNGPRPKKAKGARPRRWPAQKVQRDSLPSLVTAGWIGC
jgi:hypothetical protein